MATQTKQQTSRPTYDRRSVGHRLRARRLAQGKTQYDVASRAKMTQAALSNYENGKRDVPVPALIGIALALDATPIDLIPALAQPPAEAPAAALSDGGDGRQEDQQGVQHEIEQREAAA